MKKIISIFLFLYSTFLFAAETRYTIIIDAGDDFSELHLFKITQTDKLPFIEDIFTKKTSSALAAFAKNPENASNAIFPLLVAAKQKLISLGIQSQDVSFSLSGTEAMRALNEMDQKNIYLSLKKTLSQFNFKKEEIGTLSGKTQALYEWLDVNYLSKFIPNTVGILNVGNTSLSMAYEVDVPAEETVSLKINGKTHFVFAKSIEGWGQNSIRLEMNKNIFSPTCYPLGFSLSSSQKGNFNLGRCKTIYSNLTEKTDVKFIPFHQNQFIIFSNGYRIYHFLSAEVVDQESFESRLYYVCALPWEQMKKEYEGMPEQMLSSICANAVWIDQLIYGVLKIPEAQIWPTDKINQHFIKWPLGKVLFDLAARSAL